MYTNRSCKKIVSFTDGYTYGMVPIGILPIVAKQLRNFSTLIDSYTNGLVLVDILLRFAKQLRPLAQSPTDIPIDSPTDSAHSKVHACQTAWSVGIVTDEFAEGCNKSNAFVL